MAISATTDSKSKSLVDFGCMILEIMFGEDHNARNERRGVSSRYLGLIAFFRSRCLPCRDLYII